MKRTVTILTLISILFLSCKNENTQINQSNSIDSTKNEIEVLEVKTEQTKIESQCHFEQEDSLLIMQDSLLIIGGIVQSSGIRKFDKLEVQAKYQLESLKKSFYLVTDQNLDKYWGKCVCVKGKLAKGWNMNTKTFNGFYAFGRIALEVESISLLENKYCNNSPTLKPLRVNKYPPRDTLQGIITRAKRMSPDIGYDYFFKLSNPYPHPESESDSLKGMHISLNIELDRINSLIEKGKEVKAIGSVGGGYAELYIFAAQEIIELN